MLAVIVLSQTVSAQNNSSSGYRSSIRIMFYNIENLFDTIDCNLNDDEFLPEGERRWNRYKYYRKLENIFKVIVMCGNQKSPDIIGLCEVENINVLNDLIHFTYLEKENYKPLYADSYDERGIGVALLYKTGFKLVGNELWYPVGSDGDTLTTRSVLHVTLSDKYDTLHIVVSHWPSRRGGVSATEKDRRVVASLIRDNINRIIESCGTDVKFVIMGDFNSDPQSETVTRLLGVGNINGSPDHTGLYSPECSYSGSAAGSYKYQGTWVSYDQIVISGSILFPASGYRYIAGSYRVFDNLLLLTEDLRYKGLKPYSTWVGPVYKGGFSDHLPVIIDLGVH
ncbi:MAG: endonuclease/exonuclease/phosphatase family protein [Bacteroidales bacterium]|nr:endonuclease/exonuclease/phosphatase family protein [Bacteroidales bacterium]